ncbi:helix-turn-helix domain-containing protein [Sporosarcina limicola]|uniref:Cytoskeletal protein RodZ n=1 Tax=Sporosarcina limicola TaxID=34101 RepID=A0A927R213_9BACL|nr:helix-turn-helix domain-containing protein [Sporosarcina limicola]MBE1553396.1 cytoskeletal protein RodZ [Sporosarcina limicola]
MTGLGGRLKEARTAKGFTLEDLQSITKIQKRYLSGIENEDYSMMPGSFYVRAFIKQYAEAVGLDADEMLSLYKETSSTIQQKQETGQISSSPLTRRRGLKSNNKLNEMMPKIIVALCIIVIFTVVWFLYYNHASRGLLKKGETGPNVTQVEKQQPTPSKVDKDKELKPESEPEPEPEKPQQFLTFESVNGETSTYALTKAEAFQLKIRLNGNSWIGVKDQTNKEWMTPKADIMKTGESVEFDVTETDYVRIRVGRPKNTEIYVNGELLEYGVPPQDTVPQNIVIEYRK